MAPGIALAAWTRQTVVEMNPVRLVLPVMLALIVWVMRRLGRGGRVDFGTGPLSRHALFLIAPALVVVLAPLGWAQVWGTLEAKWVVAESAVWWRWAGWGGWCGGRQGGEDG